MNDRVLRPRKNVEQENVRPAKRTRRAFTTIERMPETCNEKLAKSVDMFTRTGDCLAATIVKLTSQKNRKYGEQENIRPAKRTGRAFTTIERMPETSHEKVDKSVDMSTQTGNCLAATNAKLTSQLIASNEQLEQKNQKYIVMLEKFFLTKEKMEAKNQALERENEHLKGRWEMLQNHPLVQIDDNGESK